MRHTTTRLFAAAILILLPGRTPAADPAGAGRREDQAALKTFGGFVGGWKGIGQVERGKTKGAWQEHSNWAWKLSKDKAALEVTVKKGKYLSSGILHPGSEPKSYRFEATLADGTKRTFAGKETAKKALVMTAADPGDGLRRITFTPLHDTRLLVKLEAQDRDSKAFYQLGEVGYTREGISFAVGESGPVCIVTEGRGSISISYKGKTYYVCCTGCRDLFNENPEAILAEAAEREKAKDKK